MEEICIDDIVGMACPFCVVMRARGSHIPSYFLVVTKVEMMDDDSFYLYYCMGTEGDNPQNAWIDLGGQRVLASVNDWNFYKPSEDIYLSVIRAIRKTARMAYYRDIKVIKNLIRLLSRGVMNRE